MEHQLKCAICGKDIMGHGHSAEPIAEGRCCDECEATEVMPSRLKEAQATIYGRYVRH